ncbi:hypothetical protein EG68_12321 [Paragonimus skrjabini miyazakii]|uniref:peptidylprolyl isomerase n=1 Tax=Paragonimus skrjabini miyazakii TaxID=59628 RepID=A0A8S9YIB5_9TREM|nr:hypothetical protein EG68_12321 [Paragonimus skrjabini miyazakii]
MTASDSSREEYLSSFEDLTENKDRGILKKIIKEGTCDIKPCHGDTVIVHYVGTYFGGEKDGEQFDSSRDRDEKFEFTIGTGAVIKAWDVGVATMKIGELCELIVAPEYGYNDDKTMKFVVELFDTKGLDVSVQKNGSVRKSVLEKGRDSANPMVGLEADISYRPFDALDKQDFRDVSYIVGDPIPSSVPECVDLAVRHMSTAERSLVRICDDYTQSAGDFPQGLDKAFEVRLRSFEKVKHLSTLPSFSEQMSYADSLKSKANENLKASKFSVAIELYKRLDEDLPYVLANGVAEQKTLTELTTAVQLNLALAYLKLGDAQSCTEKCKKVLENNASNEKALFRLGQACLLRKDHEDAAIYFRRVVSNNPKNTAAVSQLRYCEEAIQSAKDKERKMFRGVFERFKETGLGDSAEANMVVNGGEKSAA